MCNAKNHPNPGCPCGFGPAFPFDYPSEIAGGTAAIPLIPWEPADLQAFETEIENANNTIKALKNRKDQAKQEDRDLNENDMEWLNRNQFAGPTGYRAEHYDESRECIKIVIDEFESILNPQHYKDIYTLIGEAIWKRKGVQYKTRKGYMNKVMFNIEIGRLKAFIRLLHAYKIRGQ